jgi:hypothetical protein
LLGISSAVSPKCTGTVSGKSECLISFIVTLNRVCVIDF